MERCGDGAGAIGDVEASHHFTEVIANGVRRDVQSLANVAIAEAFRHPAQNFVLSFRKWLAIRWVWGSIELNQSWIDVDLAALNGFKCMDQGSIALLQAGFINAGIRMQLLCQSLGAPAVLIEHQNAAMSRIQAFDLSE